MAFSFYNINKKLNGILKESVDKSIDDRVKSLTQEDGSWGMAEEQQLDELSPQTLSRYMKKSLGTLPPADKSTEKSEKRLGNIFKAGDKANAQLRKSWGMSEAMTDDQQFVDYVMSFYGPGGVYDMDVEHADVVKAIEIYKKTSDIPFDGDTVDRENVRDILIDRFGYEFPTNESHHDISRMQELANVKNKSPVDEAEVEEGNEFSGQLAAAKATGKKEFEVDGKTYPVKEGAMKDAMHRDAERMSREKFCDKYGNESWVGEFWDNIMGDLEESMMSERTTATDKDLVRDLVLFADNDEQLYRQSYEPIIKNLQKKVAKGVYDVELAKKLWSYHTDRAAQKYAQDQGVKMPWFKMFSKADRALAAAQFEENAREEVGADELAETATDDAVANFQNKQTAEKMKRLSNPRDYFEAALNQESYLGEEDAFESLRAVLEEEGRPYVVVHARKGQTEVTASSSYDAAKKAAAKWGLKNTAGVDAYLADVKHTPVDEDSITVASPSNPIKMYSINGLAEDKKIKAPMDFSKAIKHVVDPDQKEEITKYQVTGRLDPKKFKKKFLKKRFPDVDFTDTERAEKVDEAAHSRQYNGDDSGDAHAGIPFESDTSSSGGSITRKPGVTRHSAGSRYSAMDAETGPDDTKIRVAGRGRGRPVADKAPEYTKMNDPFGRVGTAPKGKRGTVVKGKNTVDDNLELEEHGGGIASKPGQSWQSMKPTKRSWQTMREGSTPNLDKHDVKYGVVVVDHNGGKPVKTFDNEADAQAYADKGIRVDGKLKQGSVRTLVSPKVNEAAKPDFLDMDRDGNKSEPMKKAVADKERVSKKELDEKATSKKQQKFMGMVRAAQTGDKPASKEVADVAKKMTKSDVRDFAATKHKGLPERVKEENVMKIDNTAGAKESQTEPGSNKPGMEFGGGIYENFDAQVEAMIKRQINESFSINVSQNVDDNGAPSKNISVTASGDDAERLAQILSLAGITGGVQPTVEPQSVEIQQQPELSFNLRDFCPVCDCAPCECGSEEDVYSLEEADVTVSDNEPDWPTNQETSDDALQYSGGLNKPKSTGQTTVPVISGQPDRLRSVSENIDLERSLFKTWKNYRG